MLPLFVVTALTFLILDAAGFGPVSSARRSALSIGQPIGRVLAFAVSPLSGAWQGAVHYDDMAQENQQLRRRVAELEGTLAGQPDAKAELEALLSATEIDFLGDVGRVTARVAADRRTDIERVVEIDKGSNDGITAGMPVVTGLGLAGVVELVTDDHSVIRLITDVDVAVGVRSRYGLGLAAGVGHGHLQLTPTPELLESARLGVIDPGERFVTSGVDRSVYPAGIPVGTVTVTSEIPQDRPVPSPAGPAAAQPGRNTEGDDEAEPVGTTPRGDLMLEMELELELGLEPLVDLDNLGYVTVLLIEPAE